MTTRRRAGVEQFITISEPQSVPWLTFDQFIDEEWLEAFCREAGLLREDLWWLKIADSGGTCTYVFQVVSNPSLLEWSRFCWGVSSRVFWMIRRRFS